MPASCEREILEGFFSKLDLQSQVNHCQKKKAMASLLFVCLFVCLFVPQVPLAQPLLPRPCIQLHTH